METEIMKKIEGFDKYYISKTGQILDVDYNKTKKAKLLKQQTTLDGYKFVQLSKNGKIYNKKIHRLVAEAFIPNPNNLPQVNHKDENKTNNNVVNLEWVTAKYNTNYGTRTQRAVNKRKKKVLAYSLNGDFLFELDSMSSAEKLGFSQGHISLCCSGKRHKHKNIIWKYAPAQNTLNDDDADNNADSENTENN